MSVGFLYVIGACLISGLFAFVSRIAQDEAYGNEAEWWAKQAKRSFFICLALGGWVLGGCGSISSTLEHTEYYDLYNIETKSNLYTYYEDDRELKKVEPPVKNPEKFHLKKDTFSNNGWGIQFCDHSEFKILEK